MVLEVPLSPLEVAYQYALMRGFGGHLVELFLGGILFPFDFVPLIVLQGSRNSVLPFFDSVLPIEPVSFCSSRPGVSLQ